MRLQRGILLALCSIGMIVHHCGTSKVAGGSSDHGNARIVAGRIVDTAGNAKVLAKITLYPADYNPAGVYSAELKESISDSLGRYAIDKVPAGEYNIYGVDTRSGDRMLHKNILVDSHDVTVGEDTLTQPGTVVIYVDSAAAAGNRILFIPGTGVYKSTDTVGLTSIDSVPSGLLDISYYSSDKDTVISGIKELSGIDLHPGDTAYRKEGNLPPVFVQTPADMNETFSAGTNYERVVNASDPEGDRVTYHMISGPEGMKIREGSQRVQWFASVPETATVSICARDIWNGSDTLSWVLIVE